ncbi:MAG: hypothetical protein A2X36_07470 [Elusimicrobia bacterium GWA2_69_24]|nr:MAG: hypothetical protein A2X36_07470 [Elusimicrobia bacterium GWA2_69_24]HBL18980.1 hypothetical protein [Elusimicrobiota bacterium]
MNLAARLWRYVGPYKLRFIQAGIAMVIVAACNGAVVYLLKPIVDGLFVFKDMQNLLAISFSVPVLMALKNAAGYVQNYLMSWIGQRVTQELREDLFRHLHKLSLDFYGEHKSGEILARVTNDLTLVQSALQFVPLYVIRDSLTVVALFGVLFFLNWRFTLMALTTLPIAAALLIILGRKMRDSSIKSQAIMGQIYHRFQESLQAMMLIKAYNYEDGAIAKFQAENASFFDQMMRYLRATALSGPLMEFLGSIIIAFLIYYGGREIVLGRMTPGDFSAFLAAFFAAYAPTKNLARLNSEVQRGLASGERIFQVLDEKPRIIDRPGARRFAGLRDEVRVEGLTFQYPSREVPALKGLDLRVRRGETVALAGPSGSGKSTFIQLLLRLYDTDQGRILLDGTDLREFAVRSVREHVGLVTQETILFHDTVYANIVIGRAGVTPGDVERAARVANADGFIRSLPEGYHTMLGDRGMRLSGGQRQRIAIARAVLKNPAILVLDEATSNLDSTSEAEVQRALERLKEGRTVVMIAHRLSTIQNADRIYVLNQGEVAETGTHQSLLALDGLYRKLYEIQLSEPAAASTPAPAAAEPQGGTA